MLKGDVETQYLFITQLGQGGQYYVGKLMSLFMAIVEELLSRRQERGVVNRNLPLSDITGSFRFWAFQNIVYFYESLGDC